MKCPHCLVDFNDEQTRWTVTLGSDTDGSWLLARRTCPTCSRFILHLEKGEPIGGFPHGNQNARLSRTLAQTMVLPRGVSRAAVPKEVPREIAADYEEACLVLADSSKASAALSRRCLQNLLRGAGGVKANDLSNEIQQVLDGGKLPTSIAENIDAIRNVGNFAAHPNKSKSSGEIIDVEPHEAEWNLDVIESLFDFYFVQPARAKDKRELLNKKLLDAGKPPLK